MKTSNHLLRRLTAALLAAVLALSIALPVFAASSAAQAVGLFGAELAVVLGAAALPPLGPPCGVCRHC